MKLQRLTIHNIASIEDATINFDTWPLAESEVFLITGKTGSGKSTILDAICLALYADTPRMDGTKMQGDTNDGERAVKINDPRQLMRRNSGEAFVALRFVGSNGTSYEATWSVARARNKPTGNLKAKEWQLRNLDDDTCLTKEKDIRDEMMRAIGLDFRQFCRTTLLSQGEFARFLNSKDDEKAEILEKITGVNIYTKIGAQVYETTAQKRRQWEEAQQRIDATQTMSDADRDAKQSEVAAIDERVEVERRLLEQDSKRRDWLTHSAEIAEKVRKATADLEQATATAATDAFGQMEEQVRLWRTTAEARSLIDVRNAALGNVATRRAELSGLAEKYVRLMSGVAYEEQKRSKIEAEIKEADQYLEGEQERTTVYDNAQTIVSHLNTMVEGRQRIAEQQQQRDEAKRHLDEVLKPAVERVGKELERVKASHDNQTELIRRREEAVQNLDLPTLRKQQSDGREQERNIKTVAELLTTLKLAEERLGRERAALAEMNETIGRSRERVEQLGQQAHDAEVKKNVCRELYEKQKDSVDKFARLMRQRLQVGDRCPVCLREIDEAMPVEEELAQHVGGLERAFREAEREYADCEAAKNKAVAELEASIKAYERERERIDNDKSVEDAERRLAAACEICGLRGRGTDEVAEKVGEMTERIGRDLEEVEAKLKEGEQCENEVRTMRKALDTLRAELDAKQSAAERGKKAVDDCMQKMTVASELIEARQRDIAAAQAAVERLLTGQWPIDWQAAPADFAAMLTMRADAYKQRQRQRQEAERQLTEVGQMCSRAKEQVRLIGDSVAEWQNMRADVAEPLPSLVEVGMALYAVVSNIEASIAQSEQAVADSKRRLADFVAAHTELTEAQLVELSALSLRDIDEKQRQIDSVRQAEHACKALLQASTDEQAAHQAKKPPMGDDDSMEQIAQRIKEAEARIEAANIRKGELSKELDLDRQQRQRLADMIADAEQKQGEYRMWARLNGLIGDATGSKFRKIAQSYVLASLIRSANEYMKTLTDRYTLKVSPGTFVIMIEDAYQGYVSRAASTISGGESFLVSLSLALALSDIGQRISTDTLFIDEGFGTLSGEPLQNAISTLHSLHSRSGRHVGIISHVEELRERIPVQIQVVQDGNVSSSRVRVVPEEA